MIEEKLNNLIPKINSFQINTVINVKSDKFKIINGHLYVYAIDAIDNSIKVYDCKTFKEIAMLNLPFERKKLYWEILENEIVIILADRKLYFYKINIKESKLEFMHYLSEILNFCYLKKRKEIFLLTKIESQKPSGMAKSDLLGNIIFTNKIKPEIHYEYIPPTPIKNEILITHVQSSGKYFCEFIGFNDDKYIIYICGYIDSWYDYKINWGETIIDFDRAVFNSNDLNKLLFEENQYEDLSCMKIADNLFIYIDRDDSFYFNEKENKIYYIDNIFNRIIKSFNLYYPNNEKSYLHESKKIKYFYLTNDMFGIFDGYYYLYIINISHENSIVKKIKLNWIKDKYISPEIKILIYSKVEHNEYLYISFKAKDKKTKKVINEIIYGKII